jgi:hypothetical protein
MRAGGGGWYKHVTTIYGPSIDATDLTSQYGAECRYVVERHGALLQD